MKTKQNPWQQLLQGAIRNKVAPPRPEGFHTREEIAEQCKLNLSTTTRYINALLKEKKVDMIYHMCVIDTKSKPMLRKMQLFRISSSSLLHK